MEIRKNRVLKITAPEPKIAGSATGSGGKEVQAGKFSRLADRVSISGKKQLSPTPEAKPGQAKPWTVLAYFAGDCNIEDNIMEEILEMQEVGSSKEMNLLVQVDRGENAEIARYGGSKGAVRYYLQKPEDPKKLSSPELASLGEVNSAHPMVLKDFLSWGMKNFPAKNYLIIASGHGSGIGGMLTDDNYPENISLPELNSALSVAEKEAGVSPNRVLVDLQSCLMGQVETAYQLKDSASYLLASQSVVNGEDFRMGEILGDPKAADLSLQEMGEHIFNINQTENSNSRPPKKPINTEALLDLKQLPELKNAVVEFEKAAKRSRTDPAKLKEILEVKSRPGFFHNTRYTHYSSDFYAAARMIAKDPEIKDRYLQDKARQLAAALDQVVLKSSRRDLLDYNKHGNGLGVFTASDPRVIGESGYPQLAFDRDTGWSKFLTQYASKVDKKQMERRLADSVAKYPQLSSMAEAAREGLDKFDPVELTQLTNKIKLINSDHQLNIDEKFAQAKKEIFASGALGKIARINRESDEPQRQIIDGALEYTALEMVSRPEELFMLAKTALAVISGLKGEISSSALGESARKLKAASLTSRDFGGELILMLGYATRNDKITNLKNYYQDSTGALVGDLSRWAPKTTPAGGMKHGN